MKELPVRTEKEEFYFQCKKNLFGRVLVSAFKAVKMLGKGCKGYLSSVVVTPDAEASRKVEDIDMIREFPDVFPDYLPRLPPTFEVDFVIDLMPRTAPISKAPNRMAIAPLAELKKQLQDGKRLHSLQLGCACAMFKEKGQINALVH